VKQYQPNDSFYLKRGIRKVYQPSLNAQLDSHLRREKIERDAAIVEFTEHFARYQLPQQTWAEADRRIQREAAARDYYTPAWVLDLAPYSGSVPQYPYGAKYDRFGREIDGSAYAVKFTISPFKEPKRRAIDWEAEHKVTLGPFGNYDWRVATYHLVAGPHRFGPLTLRGAFPGLSHEPRLPEMLPKERDAWKALGVMKSPNWKRRKANGILYNPFPTRMLVPTKPVPFATWRVRLRVPSEQTRADARDMPVTVATWRLEQQMKLSGSWDEVARTDPQLIVRTPDHTPYIHAGVWKEKLKARWGEKPTALGERERYEAEERWERLFQTIATDKDTIMSTVVVPYGPGGHRTEGKFASTPYGHAKAGWISSTKVLGTLKRQVNPNAPRSFTLPDEECEPLGLPSIYQLTNEMRNKLRAGGRKAWGYPYCPEDTTLVGTAYGRYKDACRNMLGVTRRPTKLRKKGRAIDIDNLKAAKRNRNDKGAYLDYPGVKRAKKVEPVTAAQRRELKNQAAVLTLVAEYFAVPTGAVYKLLVKKSGNHGVAAEITGRAQSAAVENISMKTYKDISTGQKLLSWSFKIAENQWKNFLDHETQNRTIKTQTFSPLMDAITSAESVWDGRHFHDSETAEELRVTAKAEAEAAKNLVKVQAIGESEPEYQEEKPRAEVSGNSWSVVKDSEEGPTPRDRSGFGPVTMAGSVPIENKHLDLRCFAGPWTIFDNVKEVTDEDLYLTPQQLKRKDKDIYDMEKYYRYLLRNFNRPEFEKLLSEMTHVERHQAEHALSKMQREAGEDVHVDNKAEYDRGDKAARALDAKEAGKVNPSTLATRRSRSKQWKDAAE
jgi:hypothetical protein